MVEGLRRIPVRFGGLSGVVIATAFARKLCWEVFPIHAGDAGTFFREDDPRHGNDGK